MATKPSITDRIKSYKNTLLQDFSCQLELAVMGYQAVQSSEAKGELANIYISWLRTGILVHTPFLRVDLCDKLGQADVAPCFFEWDVGEITGQLYRDIPMDTQYMRDQAKEPGIEARWLAAAEEYAGAFQQALPAIVSELRQQHPVLQEVNFYYGEYLEEAKPL